MKNVPFLACMELMRPTSTALGLHALQHRGQEAAGIVTFDGRHFHAHRGLGHVGENFDAGSAEMQALQACGDWA